jgi:hypothetical protein
MNILNVQTVLETLIQTKAPITPMLWGRHGVGKSSAVHQVGKKLGYDVYSIILSQKEAVDIAGVLYIYENKALGMSVTASHPPDWFATALKKGNVVLFLDEFNMARKEVANAAFELVLDRRLNNMKLPDSVFIVCAGNPDDERYDVTPMSESLRDRFMHLKVSSDTNAWLDWARSSNVIHPDVVKFIENDPKALYVVDKKDESFPVEIKYSERSWERVGMIHKLPMSYALKTECIRGVVGPDLATAFMQSFGVSELPLDALEILQLDKNAKDRIIKMCNPERMRVDLLNQSINNLVRFSINNHALATKNINNVKVFIKMLPDDCAFAAIKELFELPGWSDQFLSDPELREKINQMSAATAVA